MTTTIRVFDSESDGFVYEATKFWCFACRDVGGSKRFFGPDEIEDALHYLMEADIVIAHNYLGHDLPLIMKLYPWFKSPKFEDTLILSRMLSPDREGGHSIEAWGSKVGMVKPEHNDWSQFSDAMRVRCEEDAEINARMLRMLQFEMGKEDWSEAIRREYDTQILQSDQERVGFNFDTPKAEENLNTMKTAWSAAMDKLIPSLPKKLKMGTHYKAPFTKSGKLNHHVAKWIPEDQHHTIMGPFTGVSFEDFNLNSPLQVSALLLENGWEPKEFNYVKKKGGGFELNKDGSYKISTPKVSEDLSCLDSVTGDLGQLIVEERVVRSKMSYIHRVRKKDGAKKGWLNEVRDDGRMVGRGIPMGTPTARYTHAGVVNVPRPTTRYGDLLRELFIADEGHVLVGTDGMGLEARVAGHYTAEYDGGEFARELMDGDIHSKNAAAFTNAVNREVSRSDSKNIYYGIIYGATARKIASMLSISFAEAETLLQAFWKANPALEAATKAAQSESSRKGYLIGLDGRRIPCRSKHSALNFRFQSTGAIIMKYAFVDVFLGQVKDPLDYWIPDHPDVRWRCMLTQHDEAQSSMKEEYVDDHVAAWVQSGKDLTEHFKFNIPIEFESKVGLNWCQTH